MITRIFNRFIFALERFFVRGPTNQLLFIAFVILLVSIVGGGIVYLALPEYDDPADSVWWAFLRLTDPGYLGDDEGIIARVVSTIVTILGYMLFMGTLVAILNQGLARVLRRLEAGVTPIRKNGHILILGWTNRTPSILRELLIARGRVNRFLRRSHTNDLTIVVLAEAVSADLMRDVRDELEELWDERRVILRSGNSLKYEHLERTDFLNASAIIIPADDFKRSGPEALDARTIKTVMLIDQAAAIDPRHRRPPITAELFDEGKRDILRNAYRGDLAVIPGARFVSRLIAQNLRHPGLSHVYRSLLSYGDGAEIYVRDAGRLAGTPFGALETVFPQAVVIGLLRAADAGPVPLLNPPLDMVVEASDRLVFVADRYEVTSPAGVPGARVTASVRPEQDTPPELSVLVLGWSGKTLPLLAELNSYERERFAVDIVSLIPEAERRHGMRRMDESGFERVSVRHFEADYTSADDLGALELSRYDGVILFASDRQASDELADARSVLGFLQLEAALGSQAGAPTVIVEMIDADNAPTLDGRGSEVIISPDIVSHMLAHVTLRRDLLLIFEDLFTVGGGEVYFRGLDAIGETPGRAMTFDRLAHLVRERGETLIGVYTHARRGVDLSPAKDSVWRMDPQDRLIVVSTYRQ